jgi:ABC-type multidrug transport system fused ATPase/permease subunit
MRAELRPSSLGEILDRTAQMYRSHFLLYFGIAAIAASTVLVPKLMGYLLLSLYTRGNATQFAAISVLISGFMGLISLLPMALSMAAIAHAVAANYLGQITTIRQAYSSIRGRWYRYVLILLATYSYSFAPIFVAAGVMGAVSAAVSASFSRNLVVGVLVVLILMALVAACWWLLRWALAIPASLLEDLKVHRSLKRSATLTKGARGASSSWCRARQRRFSSGVRSDGVRPHLVVANRLHHVGTEQTLHEAMPRHRKNGSQKQPGRE